jgi:CBS domain-containing protein
VTESDDTQTLSVQPGGMHMFHRVSYLLSGNAPVTISPDLSVPEALKLMRAYAFDQMPVVAGKEVLGLFSHRAFAERLIGSTWMWQRIRTPDDLVVEDFVEAPVYVRAVDPIDKLFTEMDQVDAVLVGDPDRLQGIVTSSDVIAYLYRVASPYLLIKETETGLRSLIEAAVSDEQLEECARRALASLYKGREDSLPTTLVAMTFDEQVSVVMNSQNWPMFTSAMGANRDMFTYEIRPIGQLRNDVFHFKRELTDEDLEKLITAREWVLRKLRRKAGQGR